MTEQGTIAGVVLAAGRSRRMGRDKRLLHWEGEPLLRRAVRAANDAGLEPVVVVVAHGDSSMRRLLEGICCEVVLCDPEASSMSESLRAGLLALGDAVRTAVVLLPDMPCIDATVLGALAEVARAFPGAVAASRCGEMVSAPVAWPRATWGDLARMRGDSPGRQLLGQGRWPVQYLDLPRETLADLDEVRDVEGSAPQARSGRCGPEVSM